MNERVFNLIFRWAGKNSLLDALGVFLASFLLYAVIGLVVFFVFLKKRSRERLFFLVKIALAMILSRGIILEVINFTFPYSRPFVLLGLKPLFEVAGPAFPSGHAITLFTLTTVVFLANWRWGLILGALSAVNGLARIFVGVHWPLDILSGAFFGILSGFLIHILLKPYQEKLIRPPVL